MIVVRIHGGLGNQLFQYAIGRRLAIATGQSLRLETGQRNTNHLTKFDLDRYNIVATIAPRLESALLWRPPARLAQALRAHRFARRHRLFIQRGTEFCDELLTIGGNVYLVGCWQSERYFAQSADTIRAELTLKQGPTGPNARFAEAIKNRESVFLHVRRGDYLTIPEMAADVVCNLDYYRRAWSKMKQLVPDAECFVFSDDIEWCKRSLSFLGSATFVDHNTPEERHEDLRLMALCKHAIIANSSFSWWGAWLSRHERKVVVGPARCAESDSNYLPPSWHRV
jgi:hypothetical protein